MGPLGDVLASGLFFIFGFCFSGAMPCAGNVGQSKNCSNVVSVEEEEEKGVGSGCLSNAVLGVEIPELFFLGIIATSGLFFVFVVCFSGAMP